MDEVKLVWDQHLKNCGKRNRSKKWTTYKYRVAFDHWELGSLSEVASTVDIESGLISSEAQVAKCNV